LAKTTKVAEGLYRTADGKYAIVAEGNGFVVNERRGSIWVTVDTAKNKAEADKKLNALTKTEDEAPVLAPEEVAEKLED